jgi:group I intron endonuclease
MQFNILEEQKKLKGVYLISNDLDETAYIGSTFENFWMRWKKHIDKLEKNKHHNIHLQRWVNKYGIEHLVFNILNILDIPEECLQVEQDQIFKLGEIRPLFNIAKEVTHTTLGIKYGEEARKKIGDRHRGKIITKEHREAISKKLKGKKFSLERNKKISNSLKGREFSKEHKNNLSKAKLDKNSNTYVTPIIQYSLDGILIKEWDRMNDITKELGINNSMVWRVCNNSRKVTHGFIFKYKEDVLVDGKVLDKIDVEGLFKLRINPDKKNWSISVSQYSIDGKFIKKYDSVKAGAKSCGITSQAICQSYGKNKPAGGYIWKRGERVN